MKKSALVLALLLALATANASSISASTLQRLVGYTIVAATSARGQFSGDLHDHVVTLENGWAFRITDYALVLANGCVANTECPSLVGC